MLQWIRSILYLLLLALVTATFGTLILLCAWVPIRRRHIFSQGWGWTMLWLGKHLCGMDYRFEGLENIPKTGAHVTMWKHSSTWETMAQMIVFPPQSWVLKREILWIPIVGWATWIMRPIAINRSAGHRAVNQVVEIGKQRLAQGMWILMFPEGTRVQPGQTRKYGLSGALLASQAGVKLIPVAHNAGDLWPRHSLYKKPGLIRVVVGPPIDAAGRDPRELNAEVQGWIEGKMREISSAYQDKPASPATGG
jgi:1-acyl-sn-glycerol-3-phosphate acyltransferase